MKKMLGALSTTSGFFLLHNVVFAAGAPAQEDILFSSDLFEKFDIRLINDIGLILPIIVAWFAVRVANLMRGGKLEQVWKLIAAGMSVLALVKVIDGLKALKIFHVTGLRNVLELAMILVFFVAFLTAYRSLVTAIRGPIPEGETEIQVSDEKKGKEKAKGQK